MATSTPESIEDGLWHNDKQPIAKIPSEILEQIFLISNKPPALGLPGYRSLTASLHISWVCSRWRAVALSNRQFWARCVSLESRSLMQDEFLRRSDPWPLDLYGATYICAERLHIFASPNVAQRIRSLMIHLASVHINFICAFFNQNLPRLETIHLYGEVKTNFAISKDTLAKADNVTEIRCRYGIKFDLFSFLDEPTVIHRLTILDLISIPISFTIYSNDLLQFLSEAHNLQSLALQTEIIPEPPSIERQRGDIKLPKLTRVSLNLPSPVAVAILPFVSFSDSLCTFVLSISLEHMTHYPTIISNLEQLVRHWDLQWTHSVSIRLETHSTFAIDAFDTPALDSTNTGWPIHVSMFSFHVHKPSLEYGEEERLTKLPVATHLASPAIQALEPMILSTAWRVLIHKSIGVPVTLDAVSSPTLNLDMNGSWNLLDGLLNNKTLLNVTQLSLHRDFDPFLRHILNCVRESVVDAARRGADEYRFLPKLRFMLFGVSSGVDSLPLFKDLVNAGFLIESTNSWELKVTLPGRYEGERPVQEPIEKILRIS